MLVSFLFLGILISFRPKTLTEYKKNNPGYFELGKLQPDLNSGVYDCNMQTMLPCLCVFSFFILFIDLFSAHCFHLDNSIFSFFVDELVLKRANKERVKEFSKNLRIINKEIPIVAGKGKYSLHLVFTIQFAQYIFFWSCLIIFRIR